MNAIILAAGIASRFVPLSYEKPKGLFEVRGERLIERQIRQLLQAGVSDITLVLGYKAELFQYLREKYGVKTVLNEDYRRYNNISSLVKVIDCLDNTFICCSDHYFNRNVFLEQPGHSYYAALFANGETNEYCLTTNENDQIVEVGVGGANCWYMAGHAFFSHDFSVVFKRFLEHDYKNESMRHFYWEDVFVRHLKYLPMSIMRCCDDDIREFDTFDELRCFDSSYLMDSQSSIIKDICMQMGCNEWELTGFQVIPEIKESFMFCKSGMKYGFNIKTRVIHDMSTEAR
ncbi:MAG: NTP transferase domain-containing protein [Bacteroidales bacterium]|nr:NTP transferase domain-containing protein [Bacteroidales bacterium]